MPNIDIPRTASIDIGLILPSRWFLLRNSLALNLLCEIPYISIPQVIIGNKLGCLANYIMILRMYAFYFTLRHSEQVQGIWTFKQHIFQRWVFFHYTVPHIRPILINIITILLSPSWSFSQFQSAKHIHCIWYHLRINICSVPVGM